MQSTKGFSLIELLVVVAIILIVLAIAVPNLARSRMAANEASAVDSVHSINQAQATYASTYPDFGFAPALTNLGPCAQPSPNAACLISAPLGTTGIKDGYQFVTIAPGVVPRTTYTVRAVPRTIGKTGQRAFCSTESQTIKFNMAGSAIVCLAGSDVLN